MKRYLITIAFDGTAYHGWQVQPGLMTVQRVMNESLEKLLGVPTGVTGCSRTDTGVHAREFAFHINCDDGIPEEAFLKGLNSILPKDIAVNACRAVPADFHARYDIIGKRYVYGMYSGNKNPFDERYFLHIDSEPDIDLMNEFAVRITGEHDFCGFSSSGRTVENTVRKISACAAERKNNKIYFSVTANGFLYNMVRILAGTALAVGYGRLDADVADRVFAEKDRSLAGDTLPAHGLFLDKVFY